MRTRSTLLALAEPFGSFPFSSDGGPPYFGSFVVAEAEENKNLSRQVYFKPYCFRAALEFSLLASSPGRW